MAKYDKGILGHFIGKLGTIIGGVWRGITYMRSKGPSTRNNNSPAQLDAQVKFSIVVKFARRMAALLKITYKLYANRMTARNKAIADILNNSIIGTYPNYDIDYSKVLVSRGGLEPALSPVVTIAIGTATFDWEPNTGINGALNTDQAILVAYCPARRQCIYKMYAGTRENATALLNLNPFGGQKVHTWICFISEDGEQVSDSVYAGEHTVS
jgi:hypothetical protein